MPPAAGGMNFTIPLPTRYPVSGVVRDSTGVPLAKADVSASICGRPDSSTETASDGSYTVMLAAGSYQIGAWKTGYESQQRTLMVTGPTTGVDFTLTPMPVPTRYTTYGYATDAESNPLDAVVATG